MSSGALPLDPAAGVASDEPFTFTVRSTRHGPLLSDVSAQLSTVGANAPVAEGAPERGNGYAVALSWTALTPNRTADAIFEIDKATDWDGVRNNAARLHLRLAAVIRLPGPVLSA